MKTLARIRGWIARHPMAARVLGNSGWLMAERILGMLIGLVVGVWVARALGPEQWGTLQYSLAFLSFFAGMAPLGLDNVASREMALYPKKRGALLGTAGGIRILSALVFGALAVAAAFARHDSGEAARILVAVLALGMLFQASDASEWFFHSTYESALVVKSKLPGMLLGAGLRIGLVMGAAPLIFYAAAESLTAFMMLAGLGFALWRKSAGKLKLSFDPALAKKLLKESWPLAFSALAVTIYMKIDQIMLESMSGAKEVGHYAAAVRLSEIWFFVPVAVVTAGFPALLEARKEGKAAYQRRFQRLSDLMALLSLLVVLPVSLLSNWLVSLLFGADYAPAGAMLRLHVWGGFFVAFGLVFGRWLTAEGKTGFYAWMTVGGAVLNILLNLALIPRYGGIGAAWATLAAYAFTGTLMPLVMPESRFLFHQQWRAVVFAPLRAAKALLGQKT